MNYLGKQNDDKDIVTIDLMTSQLLDYVLSGELFEQDSQGNTRIKSQLLPSYVDDVLEYNNKASFPTTGESGKIYVDKATNLTYRWSGTAYVEISPSLALGETSSTAYAGDKGKALADAFGSHKDNGTIHISQSEREAWNAKWNYSEATIKGVKVNSASSADSVSWSGVIGKPTSLPASDVYAWAKAATKPSYIFSEIGSKPTSLVGYGITDAKIVDGVITLGSNTIKPLTQHQSLAGYATEAWVNSKGYATQVNLEEYARVAAAAYNDLNTRVARFEDMIERKTENGVTYIRAKYGFSSDYFVSSHGLHSEGGGGASGFAISSRLVLNGGTIEADNQIGHTNVGVFVYNSNNGQQVLADVRVTDSKIYITFTQGGMYRATVIGL